MQPPISDSTKRAVIEEYLRGKSRDEIARDLRLGTGTVSKIISEWMVGLNQPIADELRELAVGLRKLGISASRYAEGARIASYLLNLGVNDEEFHQFISEIYDRCKKMALRPDNVACLLRKLLDLSESIPLAQFPEYIELQKTQIRKSQEELEKLKQQTIDVKTRLDIALDEERTTRDELNQFSSMKAVMNKNGLTMADSSRFVESVVGAKKFSFDPRLIVEKVSNLMHLEIDQIGLQERVKSLNEKVEVLKQNCSNLEQEELVHSYRISIYRELEKMGMGIKQLKLLRHTVAEIATANNISEDKATEKFFSDVREQYDDKLGFEVRLENLKSEVKKNELMQFNLSSLTAMFNWVILQQLDYIQQASSFVEFGPLVKAAKGQKVPKNHLKAAVIKAIDILITSDSTDRSASLLKGTKDVLIKDIQESGGIV